MENILACTYIRREALRAQATMSSGFLLYLRIKAIIMAGIGATFFLLYLPKFG